MSFQFDESVELPGVEAIRETDLALLCVIDEREVWIPKSQITDDSTVNAKGDVGTLVITQWLADEKGLG